MMSMALGVWTGLSVLLMHIHPDCVGWEHVKGQANHLELGRTWESSSSRQLFSSDISSLHAMRKIGSVPFSFQVHRTAAIVIGF